MNPYTLLNLHEGCSRSELKSRYKILCKMYHPDKLGQDPTSVVIFQMIQQAYTNIKNMMDDTILVNVSTEMKSNEIPVHSDSVVNTTKKVTKQESSQNEVQQMQNLVRVLGQKLNDPWFDQGFSLTDYFGDVTIPEKNKKSCSVRPISTRTAR